jgi:hypothetical protein
LLLIIHKVIKQILKFFLQEIDLLRIKKTAPIIIAGFIVAIFFSFIAIAAIDAPHNASNNISCGSCHGEALHYSAFWGGSFTPADIDDTPYNRICLSCHTELSPGEGGYPQTKGPLVRTHSDLSINGPGNETWTRECRTCHDPHYQRQKNYKNTDAGNLYLATGTITSCVYNGDGTSTLTYSTITYKSGWDSTKLTQKTGDYRRTILFPNINKLGYNYPVIAVDTPTANTITVTGDATAYLYPPTTFAAMYGQYIKDVIDVSGTNKQVKFFDQTGTDSYADGDITYNGVCEICHTQTDHFRNNGGAPDQNHANVCEATGTNCITCHKHRNGLGHGGGGSETNCVDCHGHDDGWNGGTYYGTTFSHSTHTENDSDDLKGPNITCDTCHDTNIFPCFKSGTDVNGDGRYDLSETDVCDNCHSPGGAFDGVQMAKDSWHEGVYASPTLRAGKEKWCATCHDNDPAYSRPFDPVVDVVDNPEATYEGTWESTQLNDGEYGPDINYHEAGDGSSTATWVPDIPQNGDYDVYAWWPDNEVFATNAPYTIYYNGGSETIRVNQQINGGQWNLLGTFSFVAGTSGSVVLSDDADEYVIADAIRVANSVNYGLGVYAPNVIGDNSTYGFYVTGHKINCLNCHDASKNHIDHEHRTYEVTEFEVAPNVIGTVVNPYCDSYRLKNIDGQPCINIPRPGGDPIANWQDFALCFDCHNRNEVLGVDSTDVSHTNFWDEYAFYGGIGTLNSHNTHLGGYELFTDPGYIIHADSDWDGVTYADSAESCITCHNVHGSPTKAMIRHGELISSYGTTDKVPSLNFAYRIPPPPPWATVTWRPDIPEAGTYDVYAWWTASSSNVTNAKYTIYYNGGSESVEVDQHINGDQWNKLGTYSFAAGTSGYIVLSTENYDGTQEHRYIIADAMGWDTNVDGNPDIIIDDLDPGWSREGSWSRRNGGYNGYYYSHSILFGPDPNATLQESVGGGIYSGGSQINENGVCNMCHLGYPGLVGYIRDPFLGPQVLMPKAEPDTVSNNGSGTALLTVYILDHDDDVSTIVVDLSSIDGSSSQLMYDDGTNGDVAAGDNIYSYHITVPDTVTAGDKSLPVTATDAQSNIGTNTIKVTINPG